MGKDADDCCAACRQFGDQAQPLPENIAPVLEARREQLVIVAFHGGEQIGEHVLTEQATVGRVTGNDIVLKSGAISKRQMLFVVREGRVIVADSKSSCGTYVDGRKITAPTVLREGSTVYAGDFRLRVIKR